MSFNITTLIDACFLLGKNNFNLHNKAQLSTTAALQQLMAPSEQGSCHHQASKALAVQRSPARSRKFSSYSAVALWPLPRLPIAIFTSLVMLRLLSVLLDLNCNAMNDIHSLVLCVHIVVQPRKHVYVMDGWHTFFFAEIKTRLV